MYSCVSRPAMLAVVALLSFGTAHAQESSEESAPAVALNYQNGKVVLPNKVATLNLNSDYRYLDPKEPEKLLVAWGNPPEASRDTEGAIVPSEVDPFGDTGWAVVLSYTDDGHVDDSDAREINYDDLLADMKKSTDESNAERKDAGFQTVKLIG